MFAIAGYLVLAGLLPGFQAWAEPAVDPGLKSYRPLPQLEGSITSRGSDTMRELMHAWADRFCGYYPEIQFDIEAKGSGTAPAPLLKGKSQIGPMSRKMKLSEYQPFIDAFGVRPVAVGIGLDTLAVYVHRSNPIEALSLPELDAVFSSTRNSGYQEDVTRWGQLGLSGQWQNRPIELFTRNTYSGTFEYFREQALFKGRYKDTIRMQKDSAAVIEEVSRHAGGIGYSGIGYSSSLVKTLALSEKRGGKAYAASHENVYLARYPLSRPLYIYFMKSSRRTIPDHVREFLTFVLSREGQQIVLDIGYMPLSAKVAEQQLDLVR